MTIIGRHRPRQPIQRSADLRLDDDFLDLPLAGGGGRGLEDEPAALPPPPPPHRRGRRWLPIATVVLAAAAGAGYYLSLSPPLAALSADRLDFGDVRLGADAVELAVELDNRGDKKLAVGDVAVAGEAHAHFTVAGDDCSGRELAPQTACHLLLRFTPAAPGAHQARLEIPSTAVNGDLRLPLRGHGVEPELGFEPPRLDFGEQLVGSSGAGLRLWLSNRGSAELAVDQVGLEGLAAADFVGGGDACSGVTLAPGERCAVDYRFVPTAAGLRRAEVVIGSDSRPPQGSPWLVGIGLPRLPVLRLEPERLEFGDRLVGEESAPQTVTLRNDGDGPLVLGTLSASLAEVGSTTGAVADAGFAVVTDGCSGRTVAPGDGCELAIAFRPRQPGAARTFFEIEHSAGQDRQPLPVFGTGTAPRASIDPPRLSFGEVTVATRSQPRVLRVVNSGSGPMTVSSLAIEGADRRAFEPPGTGCAAATLEPGAGCSIEVRFRPYRDGPHRAELVVRHSAGDGVHRLPVNGIGVSAELTVEPSRLDLGRVRVSAESRQRLVLENRGRAAVEVQGLELRGAYAGDFELASDRCSKTVLPPGGSCTASVRFAPRSAGTRLAELVIRHDAGGEPLRVPLDGVGVETMPPSQ